MTRTKIVLGIIVVLLISVFMYNHLRPKVTTHPVSSNEQVKNSETIVQTTENRKNIPKVSTYQTITTSKIESSVIEPEMAFLEEMVLEEIRENYPDDENIFSWQLMPIITFSELNEVNDFINDVPITNSSILNNEQQRNLRKVAIDTAWTITTNSPDSYINTANQREEKIPKDVKGTLLDMIRKNNLASNSSKVDEENAFIVFWEATVPQSIWAGMSPDKCVFTIKTFEGPSNEFWTESRTSIQENLPKCVLGDWSVYNRMAKPEISAENFCAQEQKLTYAELLIFVKHQDKSSLTIPYLIQFWLNTNTNTWHPLQMGCGSDRDIGRLIF